MRTDLVPKEVCCDFFGGREGNDDKTIKNLVLKEIALYISLGEVINMMSTVTVRGQTAIPSAIRRRHNIQPQTRLEWIDDGHSITVIPIPSDTIKTLKGMGKGVPLLKALRKYREEEREKDHG